MFSIGGDRESLFPVVKAAIEEAPTPECEAIPADDASLALETLDEISACHQLEAEEYQSCMAEAGTLESINGPAIQACIVSAAALNES